MAIISNISSSPYDTPAREAMDINAELGTAWTTQPCLYLKARVGYELREGDCSESERRFVCQWNGGETEKEIILTNYSLLEV